MNKVLVRPLRFEDALISWKWRNDPEVWEYTGNKPNVIVTEEIEKQWILEKLEECNSVRFAIEVDDVYVGNIQLTNIVNKETAEYHIFIGEKSYWDKGVASLATAQIIRFAKNVINLQSIYLSVRPENNSAIRVYEKSGFIRVNNEIKMILDLSKVNTPIVSVFMMAYNHEKYIAEAIEGVLMQKTNFDFDIVIGEDCSTDNSRQVILDYQQKYPGKFKLLLHKKNIGAVANQMAVFSVCKGKYIAMCEGDDYWTDTFKLQKQVDFLEANPDYSCCFHRYNILDDESNLIRKDNMDFLFMDRKLSGCDISTELFLSKWITQPLTMVFRKQSMDLNILTKYKFTRDQHLIYHLLQNGKAYMLTFNGGVYREHMGGIHGKQSHKHQCDIGVEVAKELFRFNKSDVLLKNNYLRTLDWSISSYKKYKWDFKILTVYIFDYFIISKSIKKFIKQIIR